MINKTQFLLKRRCISNKTEFYVIIVILPKLK